MLLSRQTQKLLQIIGEATIKTSDSVKKFEILINSDKLCISTVGNNFARDLEYALKKLQRITIDNHKQGDDNKNLREAVKTFSTFVYSIQLAFGNDFNKLKLEIVNALQNLSDKLEPLLSIVRENSPYSSKSEITTILDYLYIAIEKVKLRMEWEHLNHNELEQIFADIFETKFSLINNLVAKEDHLVHFSRIAHAIVEGLINVLQETNLDMDHYDDNIRDMILCSTTKMADALFDFDKGVRNKRNISELILYAKLCTLNILPTVKEVLDILNNKNLHDPNGNLRNFVLNAVINALGCSIQCNRNIQRILED